MQVTTKRKQSEKLYAQVHSAALAQCVYGLHSMERLAKRGPVNTVKLWGERSQEEFEQLDTSSCLMEG